MLAEIPISLVVSPAGLYRQHKAIILMLLAQLCSSLLGASAKLLQTTGELAAEQVLVAGMGIMTVLSWAYMGIRHVPDAPLGARKLWGLLLVRGIAGTVGIWGYYYSLRFLPISEATVINFLSPMIAAFAIAILLRAPFTRMQRLAGLASIIGVILIAKPWHIVWPHELNCIPPGAAPTTAVPIAASPTALATMAIREASPTPTLCSDSQLLRPSAFEHLLAIGVALIGALGGAGAFILLSWIGQDAHPMISVAYFGTSTFLFAGVSLLFQPNAADNWPSSYAVWLLLGVQGALGFLMQLLMTASLAAEQSSRALNMVYAQVVFALLVDRLAWGVTPGPVSIIGGVIVLGSVVLVAVTREGATKQIEIQREDEEPLAVQGDEEMQLIGKEGGEESEDEEVGAAEMKET